MSENQGFSPAEITRLKQQMANDGQPYVVVDSEENSDEYMNVFFVGMYEGKEVIYDAAIYTLRLHHRSEIYELAEHKAAQRFPEYKQIAYEEDENGDIEPLGDLEEEIGLYITEVMEEMEEEEAVRVSEHVELDPHIDFGIGLDAGLNVEQVDDALIRKFIEDFNEDNLDLDNTAYSFQTQPEEV